VICNCEVHIKVKDFLPKMFVSFYIKGKRKDLLMIFLRMIKLLVISKTAAMSEL